MLNRKQLPSLGLLYVEYLCVIVMNAMIFSALGCFTSSNKLSKLCTPIKNKFNNFFSSKVRDLFN